MGNMGEIKGSEGNFAVIIIGAGDMGHGIAENFAIHNYNVHLVDIKPEILEDALVKIRKSLKKLARKKKIDKNKVDSILESIKTHTSAAEAIKNVIETGFKGRLKSDSKSDGKSDSNSKERVFNAPVLIIEAVPENFELKKKIFSQINKTIGETIENNPSDNNATLNLGNLLLASNTSSMSITDLAEVLYPELKPNFAGMHFFNPVILMKSVEIIKAKETSGETISALIQIAKNIGKIPIKVKDSPGFAVNRVLSATQVLLFSAVDKGIIRPNEIDAVMRNMGMPMGAFEVMDYAGLDISYHELNYLGEHLNSEFYPPKWFKQLVEEGKLGKKSGEGIYKWENGHALIDLNQTTDKITALDLLLVQVNEALKLIDEGVIERLEDVDILIKNGTANPMGISGLLKSIGKKKIVERLEYFERILNKKIFHPVKALGD